jgi:hypothetical protein
MRAQPTLFSKRVQVQEILAGVVTSLVERQQKEEMMEGGTGDRTG